MLQRQGLELPLALVLTLLGSVVSQKDELSF